MVNTTNPLLIADTDNPITLNAWLERITENHPVSDKQAIIEACSLAQALHRTQTRASGETYLLHAMTVTDILAKLGLDTDVLIAALLHECVETQQLTLGEVERNFNPVVMRLVDGVARMRLIEDLQEQSPKHLETENQTESLRKMLLAMAEDVRVVLIKLADRLHNMRVLRALPVEKRRRMSRETLDLFAPLANRLGIWQIKWELEDLSLRYLEPETYQNMAKLLDERRDDRANYINKVMQILSAALQRTGIHAEVSGRPKHIYSIWRKMQRKGLTFNQIFDVRAIRVLVNTVSECYTTLGIIHTKWQPIRGEFDDYIANPKSNNYQSLHTAVVGPEQKIFEVQIRTHEMHHHAELGIASHWRYKEEGSPLDKNFEKKIAWLRQILQPSKEEEGDPNELLDRFKSEIIEDRVYVFSPTGQIIDLQQGSTPLDFAYSIHTQLGHCCRGAKINNRVVPLTYTLKNGDQVEILTSNQEKPSRDWLLPQASYLKTSRARAKVRQWLKKQDLRQHISEGRVLLERLLRRLNIKNCNLEQLAQKFRFKSVDELLAALGRRDITTTQITVTFNEQVFHTNSQIIPVIVESSRSKGGIYIKGVGGLLTQAARCCRPVPYDAIIGYITTGRGVVVHRRDCANALRWQDEGNKRLIEVEWSEPLEEDNLVYPVDVEINAYDRIGLLRDICAIASSEKVNIVTAHTYTNKMDNSVRMIFTFEVCNVEQLSRLLAKIDNLTNVMKVWRKS
jgi:GTP pyrophosphokinase